MRYIKENIIVDAYERNNMIFLDSIFDLQKEYIVRATIVKKIGVKLKSKKPFKSVEITAITQNSNSAIKIESIFSS